MKNNIEWKIIIPLSLVLVVANFMGWLNGIAALQWFKDNSVSILITILITILYFIIKIYEKKEQIDSAIKNGLDAQNQALKEVVLSSLNAPYIVEFKTEDEFKEYYISKISQAKTKIDDLTWSQKVGEHQHLKHMQEKEKKLGKKIDFASANIIYREVFMFNAPSRIDKLKDRLLENKGGYHCSCYFENTKIPRIQYVLIDGKEAIFTSNAFGKKFSITNPTIIQLLQSNFDLAWDGGEPLKHGHYWYVENLRKVLGDDIDELEKSAKYRDGIIEA